jgi:hypothetical protein
MIAAICTRNRPSTMKRRGVGGREGSHGTRHGRLAGQRAAASENDALEAMLKRLRDASAGIAPATPRTLREFADEYLALRRRPRQAVA